MADTEREQQAVRAVDPGLRTRGAPRPSSSGRTFGVEDPSTGGNLADVAEGTVDDGRAALETKYVAPGI